jgi:hypothetical protein
MPMTQRELLKITDTMYVAFDKLGRNGGQSLKSTDNRESLLWDMYTAKLLEARAKKRREAALLHAVEAGLAPDTDRMPQPNGDRSLFSGDNMVLMLKVHERSLGPDISTLRTKLIARGVKQSVFDECLAESERPKSKQHQFNANPVVI